MTIEETKAKRREANKRFYAKNREQQKARSQKWRAENVDRAKAVTAKWRSNNKERYREVLKKWKLETEGHRAGYRRAQHAKTREQANAKAREWKRNNHAICIAQNAKRTAAKLRAIPKWANLKEIEKIYEQSRVMSEMTGEQYHVDHIVPLVSDIVCGLHCEANLQIIPASVNQSKSNRLIQV